MYDICNTPLKIFSLYFCNTMFSITFDTMKRTILTVEVDPELKEHLEKQAVRKKVTLSRYVRAAIKKASGYKEKEIL